MSPAPRRGRRTTAAPTPAPEPVEEKRSYVKFSEVLEMVPEIVERLKNEELFTEIAAEYAALPTVRKALTQSGFDVYGEKAEKIAKLDMSQYPDTAAGDKKLAAFINERRQAPNYEPYYTLALKTDLSEIQIKELLEDHDYDTARVIKPKPPKVEGRGRGRPRKVQNEDEEATSPAPRGRGRRAAAEEPAEAPRRGRGRPRATTTPEPAEEPVRRGRGRPRATVPAAEPEPVRRGRGRPRKDAEPVAAAAPAAGRRRRSRPTA